ncbi:MAG: NERD domain-containing protein [Proteobacteria bacterium]|nr:NERD domain-containing protein [Pseudomonadota bacterium]
MEGVVRSGTGEAAKRAAKDLSIRKAGIKGESESAYLIDFHFAASPNWAVIHDLRVEHNGRVAQVDHLLINRWMECYVLESKHFHAGIKITEDGEFMRWNDYKRTFEGLPSPLLQNERHIAVLRDLMSSLELPTRLGMRINFAFQTLVLVSPGARIDRPAKFDSSRVIKADQIKQTIWRDIDKENALLGFVKTAAKIVSGDTVRDVAQQLANRHRPAQWPVPQAPASVTVAAARPASPVAALQPTERATPRVREEPGSADAGSAALAGPHCKSCQGGKGSIVYGKYGYYFQCTQCGANTNIKFVCLPGHKPRLRKAGNQFYRDCAECGMTQLYFTND